MALTAEAGGNCFTALNSGLKDQASLIRLQIMEDCQAESPWMNLFESGTVAPHEGETIITQMAGRPLINQNLTQPEFTVKSALCNMVGPMAAFGSEQYTALLEGTRGSSPWFCLHDNFNKLDRELEQHIRGLRKMIKELLEADARNNLHVNSGWKYVASTALQPNARLTGGEFEIATDYAGGLPNAGLTIREIIRVMIRVQQNARLTCYRTPGGGAVRLIGSAELGENLRNETTNYSEQASLVEGSDEESTTQFKKYKWDWKYRQIQFGTDPVPLRFNEVDGDGFPILITPYENKIGNEGEHAVVNSEWDSAGYEVAFLVWRNTFKRLVPESFLTDGSGTKWPELANSAMGELIWSNIMDNCLNSYGDRGRFLYQIIRAWQPDLPWAAVPMIYRRCDPTDGLTACTSLSD